VRTRGARRGLVGASAAIAWPGRRATWELIAYRPKDRWGQPRGVDAASVRHAAAEEPDLFLCHDARTRRLLVTPHTPCPILYGLRATSRTAPVRARRSVRSETVDRWMLFRTNQGTGDHLVARSAAGLGPYRSAVVRGRVAAVPETTPGGHARFVLEQPDGARVPCVAFEPTKTLPRVARTLELGDRLRVWGSRGRTPGLRLEGFALLPPVLRLRTERPRCLACGRPGRSRGRLRGFECPGCGRRWPPEAARRRAVAPAYPAGTYHPTPSARRHLAPLAPER
jgi:tRNA(Ile2)-agmatinylcytidine synthase